MIVIGVAWVMGTNLGDWVNAESHTENALRREIHTAELLEHMGTIKVGDTLPNFGFDDLDRKYWKLSELVTEKTAIIFFDYHCDNCMVELGEIKKAVNSGADPDRFLLISSTNPLYLQSITDSLDFPCRFLYDEDRVFADQLGIFTYPLTIETNRNLQITNIDAGILYEADLVGFK